MLTSKNIRLSGYANKQNIFAMFVIAICWGYSNRGMRFLPQLTEDGIAGVHGDLVFRRVADQPLRVREGYIARCGPVTLIISDDLDFSVLKDTYAGVRGAQVDSDRWCLRHRVLLVVFSAVLFKFTLKLTIQRKLYAHRFLFDRSPARSSDRRCWNCHEFRAKNNDAISV